MNDICKDFLKNDSINPRTGYKIKKNGPTYKKLLKECEKKVSLHKVVKVNKKITKNIDKKNVKKENEKNYKKCKKFEENNNINPFSGRKIKRNGPTYKKLIRKCDEIKILYKLNNNFKSDKEIKTSLARINTSIRKVMKTPKKNDLNLIIKHKTKKIKSEKGLIDGTVLMEIIMIYYLIRKHKDKIDFFPNLQFQKLLEELNTKSIEKIQTKFSDLGFIFVFQKNNTEYDIITFLPTKNPSNFIFNLKNSKKRYVISPLIIKTRTKNGKYESGHANAIIYDRKENIVYRFEPHGYNPDRIDINDAMNFYLTDFFSEYGIEYKNLSEYCPLVQGFKRGPQAMETYDSIKGDPGGFCSYWTTYFLDFLIENHNKPKYRSKSVGEMLTIMLNSIEKTFKNFKEFIRTYAVFFNEVFINIGNKKNIDRIIDVTLKDL